MSERTIELYPLPPNWKWMTIGEVTAPVTKINPRETPDEKFIYLDISSIDNRRNVVTEVKSYTGKNAPSRARQVVKAHDILFSTVRTYLKNIALVPKQYDGQLASTGFSVLRAVEGVENKYLFYYVLSRYFLEQLNSFQRGTSYPAVRDQDVRIQPIPIPPPNEQRRIVAKIEELFSQLDAGVAALEQARAQLKRYRQALLKAAFTGRLTEAWRQAHLPDRQTGAGELEDAAALLGRIRAEREERWRAQMRAWEEAVRAWEAAGKPSKKSRKPRKPKDLPPLTEEELAELPELPQGWAWDRLGLMTLGVEYGTSAKSQKAGKIPVLRMGNIQNFKFDWNDLVFTDDEEEIEKYLLKSGDVLFNRTNSPELVGKTAIFQGERKAIFAGYLIRINHFPEMIDSRYLNYFLNSLIARNYGNLVKTDGVNQSNISGSKLVNYPFPYCSIAEQKEVADALDLYLSSIDYLDQIIEQALARAAGLRQAILKKAFAGELVPPS